MKCKNNDCNNETSKIDAPKEILLLSVPFTKIEIRVWNWNNNDYNELCNECLCELEDHKYSRKMECVYDQGFNDGYLKSQEEK